MPETSVRPHLPIHDHRHRRRLGALIWWSGGQGQPLETLLATLQVLTLHTGQPVLSAPSPAHGAACASCAGPCTRGSLCFLRRPLHTGQPVLPAPSPAHGAACASCTGPCTRGSLCFLCRPHGLVCCRQCRAQVDETTWGMSPA